ncbi:hypothetical protein YQE_07252, partial [Dendroctonus ponderosae]
MFFRNSAEMGNILFPCRTDKNTSENVINLSQSCMERLIRKEKEVEKKYPEVQELQIPENLSEKEWMMKLKCLDDAHSNTYGLTVQAFYKLIDKVESQIEPVRPGICDPDKIIECLKKNSCCTIRCRSEMEKYIDCVDTFRINIIKEQVECERKEKRKEEQEIVEQFLKSEIADF